jgi:hypothetical protein
MEYLAIPNFPPFPESMPEALRKPVRRKGEE